MTFWCHSPSLALGNVLMIPYIAIQFLQLLIDAFLQPLADEGDGFDMHLTFTNKQCYRITAVYDSFDFIKTVDCFIAK